MPPRRRGPGGARVPSSADSDECDDDPGPRPSRRRRHFVARVPLSADSDECDDDPGPRPSRRRRHFVARVPLSADSDDCDDDPGPRPPVLRPVPPMVLRDKTGEAPLGTGDKLENTVEETTMNTVIPSVVNIGDPQDKTKFQNIQCTVRDTQSILTDIEKTITAILNEMITLKGENEEQTVVSANLRIALRGQTAKVSLLERVRNATLIVVQNREKELERVRKDAQVDRQKLEQETLLSLTTMETEQQKLIVERGDLKQEKAGLLLLLNKERATLQCELECALAALHAGKAKCDLMIANTLLERKKLEDKLALVEAEKEDTKLAIADAKAMILQKCDDMVKMGSSIHNLKSDKRKLVDQLSMMGKEVDDAKNKIMSQNAALEESVVDRRKLTEDLLVTTKDAFEKKRKIEEAHKTALGKAQGECWRLKHDNAVLQRREESMKVENRELQNECLAIRQELLEEREKGLCQICVESPKDTMCMPCLHFHYCSTCLEKHKQRSRTCPFCRTILSGTLKSDIPMQS